MIKRLLFLVNLDYLMYDVEETVVGRTEVKRCREWRKIIHNIPLIFIGNNVGRRFPKKFLTLINFEQCTKYSNDTTFKLSRITVLFRQIIKELMPEFNSQIQIHWLRSRRRRRRWRRFIITENINFTTLAHIFNGWSKNWELWHPIHWGFQKHAFIAT